ncbi:MAG: SH3 domain-containing protein [Desulfatitalea sp.]|nr:SH3 domain-containing protein [Desulfatitalea sp.]NNJ99158.1 SH3 domain-containing protein [Desulfatitalea sp.]
MKIGILLMILTTCTAAWAGDQVRYIHCQSAPVWAAPSFSAERIGALTQGHTVQVLRLKDGWAEVQGSQLQGWMLALMLSVTPTDEASGEARNQAIELLEQRARRRPSAFAATAAARGLRDKSTDFARDFELDFNSLETIAGWRVTDEQAMEFLKQGRP